MARVSQAQEHPQQDLHIVVMEPGRRLIQQVEHRLGRGLRELARQLDSLRLPSRQGVGRLSQANVTEPHFTEGLQQRTQLGNLSKQLRAFFRGELQDIRDALPLVGHFQGLPVVTPPRTRIAGHIDIVQEVHVDAHRAPSLTLLATPSLHVETESPGRIATQSGHRQLRKEFSNVLKGPGVGRGIRSRRSPEG